MSVPPAKPQGDATAVIRLYRSEDKIHPRSVDGLFARWRWAFVALTQGLFYGLPWLTWGDRPAVLFDLGARRFYVFGLVLYPQDFVYLAALLMISAFALFLFTAVAGRVWCGYACPQTVYTEIYMLVERWFEGDRNARMRLEKAPWSWNKLWRKSGKQIAWIVIGLWTGFSFVGYFTPIHTLGAEVLSLGLGPWETFWVLFYGFATYGNAGYMREQVCKYMCPYARFQSAMFDRDTLIISYDAERGEPRGKNALRGKKGEARSEAVGDCIDCGLCVQVCPTGIDIRDGLQYECIGCAACIDVCDGVMDKMATPRGLIRYDTENGLEQHLTRAQRWRRVLRPRVMVYSAVLLLIGSAVLYSLLSRHSFRVDVVRDRASLARLVEDGWIENVYRLQIMNAAESPQRYRVAADGLPGLQLGQATVVEVGPADARWVAVSLRMPPEAAQALKPGAHPLRWQVSREGQNGGDSETVSEKSTFVVPR
ncbi:cytochrome c oxidase accessory protein CcoG [Roseateles saccharophilus]|uniref:Cytochrome c oxidase accessory protein FixG n=1 Tax=Roseateles saccharophilus TaxID=304 RepID=A0A4V2VSX6_ROSSA|nr:cytochrome c oxidase accessory protein CcoG [Roseateles saccharophilus]MDG0832499.1 cytochrome c oxidase accessory protein CcoG [Roseateles saccharophilus]TCV03960.1 cytochrome c oxidase accessory protein FixG [Roseateles saccharophilus]